MRDMTVVLKYEIPAIRNSDFLTGNYLSEFIKGRNRKYIRNRYKLYAGSVLGESNVGNVNFVDMISFLININQ